MKSNKFSKVVIAIDPISISLSKAANKLVMASDQTKLGSQYDNYAQQFVFSRPDEHENDNLILLFDNGKDSFAPVNIGTGNSFPVSNALTQTQVLRMQAAFERNGDMLAHTGILLFSLRPSLLSGGAPIEAWPEPIQLLSANTFAGVGYADDILSFHNIAGDEVASVIVATGVADHAVLTNLGYEQSGHTGFASAAEFAGVVNDVAGVANDISELAGTIAAHCDDPAAHGRETGTVTLTNTMAYPFNNSAKTVTLVNRRATADYFVDVQPGDATGDIGRIVVSGKQPDGFKLAFTGSATSATLRYAVQGGLA